MTSDVMDRLDWIGFGLDGERPTKKIDLIILSARLRSIGQEREKLARLAAKLGKSSSYLAQTIRELATLLKGWLIRISQDYWLLR